MKQLYQQLLRLMPYLFWTLIAIVSMMMLVELAPKENGWKYWDKLQHAAVFLILGISGYLAFKNKMWFVAVGLVAFGAIIEVLQARLTTTRIGDVYDWLADIMGILIAMGIMAVSRRLMKQNKP